MAKKGQGASTDAKVKRSVARTLGNATLFLVILGVLGFWGSLGLYTLEPGQAALILRLGKYSDTVAQPGLKWTLPPPIDTREIVKVGELRNEDFGRINDAIEASAASAADEARMQTGDNNIVRVSYAVQYKIGDPYEARYNVADLISVVRSAAAAAMREVVGRMTVDGVLREERAALTSQVETKLTEILSAYDAGIEIQSVVLQDVQPPAAVRAAFDDVVAATQDANRAVNEAEGYRNELIPSARAEAIELVESANAYRDSKIAEATGEAARFTALSAEYAKAKDVTRKRLYLETMEEVLPSVEKVLIEPGTSQVLPYLPLGQGKASQ
ncbi:MAG: FtsH protease activity modulator HflK [Myxococcota bacterium]